MRIRFSDGRVSWFANEGQIAETVFVAAVEEWARRHGADGTQIEWE